MRINLIFYILEQIYGTYLLKKICYRQRILNKCTLNIMKDYNRNFFASNISFNLIFSCCDVDLEEIRKKMIIKYFEYNHEEFTSISNVHFQKIYKKLINDKDINIYKKILYFVLKNNILENYPSILVSSESALKDLFERSIPRSELELHINSNLKERLDYIGKEKTTNTKIRTNNLQNTEFKCFESSFMKKNGYFYSIDSDFQLDRNIYIKDSILDKKSEISQIKNLIRKISFSFFMDIKLIQAYSHVYFKCNFAFIHIKIDSVLCEKTHKQHLMPDLNQFRIFNQILGNGYEVIVKDFFGQKSKFNRKLTEILLSFFQRV